MRQLTLRMTRSSMPFLPMAIAGVSPSLHSAFVSRTGEFCRGSIVRKSVDPRLRPPQCSSCIAADAHRDLRCCEVAPGLVRRTRAPAHSPPPGKGAHFRLPSRAGTPGQFILMRSVDGLWRDTLWSVRTSRPPPRGGSQTGRGSASRFGRHGGRSVRACYLLLG